VGKAGEWLGHFKAIMPAREKYSKNVGLWQTEIAQLNEVVHLWAYRDLNDRAAVRAKVVQDPEWQAFLGKGTSLLTEMRSVALTPVPASPMTLGTALQVHQRDRHRLGAHAVARSPGRGGTIRHRVCAGSAWYQKIPHPRRERQARTRAASCGIEKGLVR
jgi:hypothetical protein